MDKEISGYMIAPFEHLKKIIFEVPFLCLLRVLSVVVGFLSATLK